MYLILETRPLSKNLCKSIFSDLEVIFEFTPTRVQSKKISQSNFILTCIRFVGPIKIMQSFYFTFILLHHRNTFLTSVRMNRTKKIKKNKNTSIFTFILLVHHNTTFLHISSNELNFKKRKMQVFLQPEVVRFIF